MTQRTGSENLKNFLRSKINFYGLKDIDKAIEIKYFLTGRNIKGSDGYDVEMKISSRYTWLKKERWWEGQQCRIFDIGITFKSEKV